MPTILILGASRGIGLGLVHEFARRGFDVIATERTPSDALHATGARIEQADVTDRGSLMALRGRLEGAKLDILLVNAGVVGNREGGVADAGPEVADEVFRTNAIGPAVAAELLLPLVPAGGTLAFTTSAMGSIAENDSGGYALYRASKAALNMFAKCLSVAPEGAGRSVLVLHPGWVQTDMGGPNAAITVETSCTGLADVLTGASGQGGIRFVAFDGRAIPW